MKIVFVCDTLGSGGAEKVISTLANEFVLMNHQISIIMISFAASDPFYKISKDIKVFNLIGNLKKKPFIFKKTILLKRLLIELKPDIVISFLSTICIHTWLALRKTDIPYIVSERNDPNSRNKIIQFLFNKSIKKASGCVFQTNDALNWYKKIANEKSTVIYNPINLTYYPQKIKIRKKQVLFVGRLSKQKNCFMIIDAFKLFHEKHSDYSLKMYGDGPLRNSLELYINDLGLSSCVELNKTSKDWHKTEFDSRLYVLGSLFEGMPNALAEALSLGISCVSTDCPIGGPKELKSLFSEELLELSPNGDAYAFAEAMERMLQKKPCEIPTTPESLTKKVICNQWMTFIMKIVKKRLT